MRTGSSSNSFVVHVVAICLFWLALLFGCLALSANCRSDHHRQVWRNNTRGVLVSGSAGNATASHTDVYCFADAPPATPEEESKLKIIFCTYKCYCHNDVRESICYCCQKGSNQPTCYDKLQDCQANCPVCNPKCPAPPATTAIQG